MQKADPYLNVDPGTMSPFQHGEVFVTEDGYESDLDLGHYCLLYTSISMCTVTIVVTWAYAAAYQVKLSRERGESGQALIGILALVFQVVGVLFTGWGFLLLACLGYIPGFLFYRKALTESGQSMGKGQVICVVVIALLGIISIPMTFAGIIPVF